LTAKPRTSRARSGEPFDAGDGREADERRGALADPLEDVGAGDVGEAVGQFEEAVRAIAAGMDDALGNAFVVEVEDLLAEMRILEQHRPARAIFEAVLVVGDRHALRRRQGRNAAAGDLMRLASIAHRFGEAFRHRGGGGHLRRLFRAFALGLGRRGVGAGLASHKRFLGARVASRGRRSLQEPLMPAAVARDPPKLT
jgi:hypothetical protein